MNTPPSAKRSDSERHDFALTEYKEASMAFFKGVDIGFSFLRFFFIINAALATILQLDDNALKRVVGISQYFPYAIPGIGVLFSLGLLSFTGYYGRQLDKCAERCSQIEKDYGGRIFTEIDGENKGPRLMTSTRAIASIAIIIGALWVVAFPGVSEVIKGAARSFSGGH